MDTKVYNQDGQAVGTVTLVDSLFGIEPNESVVHQYVVNYLARQRQGNAKTKTRREIRGGGKKPFKQKGTGNARMGTLRTPLRPGGGTVFGPIPRLYGSVFPAKMKKLAIASVLSDKVKTDRLRVIDKINLADFSTKSVTTILGKLSLVGRKCLIVDQGSTQQLILSVRNIRRVKIDQATTTNGYDLLDAEIVIFTKAGLEKAQEMWAS
jgi:large subunit ribosomal protein L4